MANRHLQRSIAMQSLFEWDFGGCKEGCVMSDDLQKAVDLTENALQAHPDLVGMFCCNASNRLR